MKSGIHPELFEVKVHCTCGNEFMTRSTSKEIRATLCSGCHPFYTGQQKFVDTAGRIEKFQKRYEETAAKTATKSTPEKATAKAATTKSSSDKKTTSKKKSS